MPVDPRICCAAEVCCEGPAARAALISLLADAGVDGGLEPAEASKAAGCLADGLKARGVRLMTADLADAIKAFAHPVAVNEGKEGEESSGTTGTLTSG